MQLYMITTMGARVVGNGDSATRLIGLAEQLAAFDRAALPFRSFRVRYEVRTADGTVLTTIAA